MTGVLITRGNPGHKERHMGGCHVIIGAEAQLQAKELLRTAGHSQKLGKGKE